MKTPPSPPKPAGLLKSAKRYPGVDLVYHVAFYHAARVGYQDIISRSLHDFKDGLEPQTARWISLAAPMICSELNFDLIVRVLGSTELAAAGEMPLDRLCNAIAQGSGATYAPERLTKGRAVRALTSLGGRIARQKELEGAYTFDAAGLPQKLRILLVDDLATTGATLESVGSAIKSVLSEAEILYFVLARVDAQLQNTHLDPQYFLNGVPQEIRQKTARPPAPAPAELVEAMKKTARMAPPAPPEESEFKKKSSRAPAVLSETGKMRRPSAVPVGAFASPARKVSFGPASSVRKGLDTRFYVVGLLLSLVLLGGTVLIPVKKDPAGPTQQFVQLVNQNAIKSPDPIPEHRSAPPADLPAGKPAVVTVPSTGLRMSHSMDSRPISRITVRQREHVEILRRFSPQTGPDWFQIRTKGGSVGWVVASVIKELRG